VHCIDQLQRGQHAVDQVFATRSKAFTVMKSVSGHTSVDQLLRHSPRHPTSGAVVSFGCLNDMARYQLHSRICWYCSDGGQGVKARRCTVLQGTAVVTKTEPPTGVDDFLCNGLGARHLASSGKRLRTTMRRGQGADPCESRRWKNCGVCVAGVRSRAPGTAPTGWSTLRCLHRGSHDLGLLP